jgi:hypothetical protein
MARALGVFLLGLALVGAAAAATIRGTARADRIQAADGRRQTITCGRALDTVNADLADRIASDCEVVARRIARDATAIAGAQHATIVEPDSASSGNTVVTAFQVGRVRGGGAGTIGWASSRAAGRTWRSGVLPGVGHASDPTVAFDARHAVWLVITLGITDGPTSLDVNRSSDGRTWSSAAPALSAPRSAFDKEWIACDNAASSPRRGTCYIAYTDLRSQTIAVISSSDGGLTWSSPTTVGPRGDVVDGLPATLPDGTLVVAWLDGETVFAARSATGGASFEVPIAVDEIRAQGVPGLRAPPLPALDVDRRGRLLLAWHDCRFRPGCAANDIVLSTSVDGAGWSPPVRVTTGAASYFTPGLGTDARTNGVVVSAQAVPEGACCSVGMAIAVSRDGSRWSPTRRLDARTMSFDWLPRAGNASFLGDYLAASWVGGRPVAIVPIASPPRAGRLEQSLYAGIVR